MKKLLVFILILMMVIPVQAFAGISPEELPEKETGINGMFEILTKTDNQWENVGSLGFGKFQETKEIDLGEYLKGTNALIKISQKGGGASYLDAVFLDGMQAVKANGSEGKVLNKLAKEDLDITPVEDGIILEFSSYKGEGILSVTGRIENELISQEPLQFPLANNYKHKYQIRDFYNYKLNTNYRRIAVDGVLDEVENLEAFAQEYQVPGSGHPAGDTYFWVMNDDENLYVTMDFTPDNTYDGDKDYAKVYVKTDEGIKEFKVSVPDTTWGSTGFTYTDKVVYEHKVYEFSIPLSEIGNVTEELELAFVGYGTATAAEFEESQPDLAYHSGYDIYLSVFTGYNLAVYDERESYIYGQLVDNKGIPFGDKFIINDGTENEDPEDNGCLQLPSVAVDKNNNFLVAWSQGFSNDKIYAAKVEITKSGNSYNVDTEPAFRVSNNKYEDFTESCPDIAYDSKNDRFLIVWQQYRKTGTIDVNIYGSIVDIDGDIKKNTFVIDIASGDQENPSVSYSTADNKYLFAWHDDENVYASVIGDDGAVNRKRTIDTKYSINPNVSYNDENEKFLITWSNLDLIKGAYYNILDNMPNRAKDPFVIAELDSDYSYYIYPAAYFDGADRMLCVWDPGDAYYGYDSLNISNYGFSSMFAKLRYIGSEGPVGDTFNTVNAEPVALEEPIAITGNLKGQFLIAYETGQEYDGPIGIQALGEYEPLFSTIGYRLIGDLKVDPYLTFEEDPYRVQLGKTIQTELNYFDGVEFADIDYNNVTYFSGNPEVATISTSGAITGISVSVETTTISAIYATSIDGVPTTLSAITNVEVYKKSSPGPSPQKTIIGQVIVDGKVLKDIYAEDLVSDGGIYSFEASKTGDNAKLWLLGSHYKQIADKNPNGVLQLVWDAASYNLPLKSEGVLNEVNNIAGSKVNIILEKVDDEKLIESAAAAVDKLGGKMVSGLVDFSVTVEGKSKEVNIDKYSLYVERTIDQLNKLDAYSTTAMKLLENDEFTFAPSVFGNNAATIKYRGNGIFAVVNNPKSFSDIAAHWSKMNVEKLAARNIAFGKSDGLFAPNDYVTRAEFAVMITRALGITEEEGNVNFEDVQGWYEEDIATAYDAGLINGRGDGKFYPNERIQRKDMAVMIHNALKFAGKGETVKNKDSVLSMFTDSSKIDEYAKESVALCSEAGIIMGRDTKEFDPDENATRAEASAIIERMLKHLEFIN
jgi:hypothetical protein